ncbi:MAG TPA: HD domain-containing phosphohydrolase [Nitrospirota bacterium]|nr:HD domain-containing phosphohydrolase [Nitrospirota bacterium]
MKTYPLRTFIHRVLLVRLGIASAAIAIVVGLFTYGIQHAQLKRDVADLGRRGVFTLHEKVRFEMERQHTDVVTALSDVFGRGDPPVVYRAGRFVHVQVYDRASLVLAEQAAADQPDIEGVKAFVAGRPFSFPDTGEDHILTTRINGAPFVFITAPIADRTGKTVAFARGMFEISEEETALMQRALVRNTLFVIAIVMIVSALLYPVVLQLTRRLADYSTNLLDANLETLSVLGSAIAKRDSDTDAHNYRVTLYSVRIGEALGLSPNEMRTLIKGSFLHDVGKLGIPDNVLLKPAKLDAQEFSVMKTHVEKGADIVKRSSWLRDGTEVVGYHHEKFSGGGYPRGLRGEEIPITARIFAVSDVFDALTSQRPYKKPLTFVETMDILEQDRGRHFDPEVLDTFGTVARKLYDSYVGRVSDDLREELTSVVMTYFSAGMETLRYGDDS